MSQPPSVQQQDALTWQQAMFSSSQKSRPRPSKHYGPHDVGRVYQIHETTESVAIRVFLSSPGINDHPDLKEYCQGRLREIQARSSNIGKTRPCVVIKQPAADKGQYSTGINYSHGPQLLILATLGGTPYDDVPYVLQHFMDPMLPNSYPTAGPPVSTKPPWYNPDQWLFQFLFHSTRRIKGLWIAKRQDSLDAETGPGYQFSRDTVEYFKNRCEERMDSWGALCIKDPGFLPTCIDNFRVRCLSSAISTSTTHLCS